MTHPDPLSTYLISGGGIQRIAEELARLMRAMESLAVHYRLPEFDEREASVHPIARSHPVLDLCPHGYSRDNPEHRQCEPAHPAPTSPPSDDNPTLATMPRDSGPPKCWRCAGRCIVPSPAGEYCAETCPECKGLGWVEFVKDTANALLDMQKQRDAALEELERVKLDFSNCASVGHRLEAELERVKAENGRLDLNLKTAVGDCDYVCGQREALQKQLIERTTKLTDSERLVSELRAELAKREAAERAREPFVFASGTPEAIRDAKLRRDIFDCVEQHPAEPKIATWRYHRALQFISEYRHELTAGSALEPSQPEPVKAATNQSLRAGLPRVVDWSPTDQESEPVREIVVGDKVQCDFGRSQIYLGTVLRVDGSQIPYLVEYEVMEPVRRETWMDARGISLVSDPPPVGESGETETNGK